MKIQQEKAILEIEGFENKGKSFNIKQSARAFEILSSNIYSDKTLAVVRELGCNARDAHIAAGKEDVPFDVHLPNQFEPWFSIRDYGIGLSHDQIMTLYVTYFDSTKGDSNEMVGALGLGSKSPFAYTDQFTVTAWYNGVKRQYSAYIDEERCPAITPLDEGVPTDESNGLEVYMAVKPNDFSTFASKAKKVFHRFPTLPNVTGNTDVDLIKVEYALEGTNYKVRKNANFNSMDHKGCYAVQGAVAYPIDIGAFSLEMPNPLRVMFQNCPIDIIFPIGELNITASRERLNYDKITQKNLIDIGTKVLEDLPKKYENVLASAKTLWEAKRMYKEWWNAEGASQGIRDILKDHMIWNGQPVTRDHFNVKLFTEEKVLDPVTGQPKMVPTYQGSSAMEPVILEKQFGEVTVFGRRDLRKVAPRGSTYKQHLLPVGTKNFIIIKDRKPKNFGKFIKHHFTEDMIDKALLEEVLVVELHNPADKVAEQSLLDSIGNPPDTIVFRTSTMDDPPLAPKVKDANATPTQKIIRKLMYVSRMTDSSDFNTTETTTDMNEGGLFVVLYDKRMVVPGHESDPKGHTDHRLPSLLFKILSLGFLDTGLDDPRYKKVFAVNSTFKNSLIKNEKWQTVWDNLRPTFEGILKDDEKVAAIRFLSQRENNKKYRDVFGMFDNMDHVTPDKSNSKFIKYRQYLLELVDTVKDDFHMDDPSISGMGSVSKRFIDMIYAGQTFFTLPTIPSETTDDVTKFFNELDKQYPLLADMACQYGNGEGEFDSARIMHYINLCDGMPSIVAKSNLTPKT